MSIRDALTLKNWRGQLNGQPIELTRPSALDLIEALEVTAKNPTHLSAWLVMRHLVEDGAPVFSSVDEVLRCDALMVQRVSALIEQLYAEGRD